MLKCLKRIGISIWSSVKPTKKGILDHDPLKRTCETSRVFDRILAGRKTMNKANIPICLRMVHVSKDIGGSGSSIFGTVVFRNNDLPPDTMYFYQNNILCYTDTAGILTPTSDMDTKNV